jgi:hypothetical protein
MIFIVLNYPGSDVSCSHFSLLWIILLSFATAFIRPVLNCSLLNWRLLNGLILNCPILIFPMISYVGYDSMSSRVFFFHDTKLFLHVFLRISRPYSSVYDLFMWILFSFFHFYRLMKSSSFPIWRDFFWHVSVLDSHVSHCPSAALQRSYFSLPK